MARCSDFLLCSPAPGQDSVNSRDAICRGLHLHEVVRFHQTRGGLQQQQKAFLCLGRAEDREPAKGEGLGPPNALEQHNPTHLP